jgi:hypothetical protein
MSHELEAAAADSVVPVLRQPPRQVLAIGAPCPNCATPLAGPWCHACGQSGEDFHRSLWRLTKEAVGGLFDVDSRLWRTLPRLVVNPGRLTRDYLDGHRAAQAPPFRMFLIVVLLVFLTAGIAPTPGAHMRLFRNQAAPVGSSKLVDLDAESGDVADKWFAASVKAARANPMAFEATMVTWGQRLAVLTLPISAALLGLMFFWRRGVYMFDHLIFSMHMLSFQGALFSTVMLLQSLTDWAGLLFLASPIHLFFHLRGTYGLGVFGALFRVMGLFLGSLVGFVIIMVCLVLIGLYEVGQ